MGMAKLIIKSDQQILHVFLVWICSIFSIDILANWDHNCLNHQTNHFNVSISYETYLPGINYFKLMGTYSTL